MSSTFLPTLFFCLFLGPLGVHHSSCGLQKSITHNKKSKMKRVLGALFPRFRYPDCSFLTLLVLFFLLIFQLPSFIHFHPIFLDSLSFFINFHFAFPFSIIYFPTHFHLSRYALSTSTCLGPRSCFTMSWGVEARTTPKPAQSLVPVPPSRKNGEKQGTPQMFDLGLFSVMENRYSDRGRLG